MRYLSGKEENEAMNYIDEAAKTALQSNCLRSRCGSIIVNGGEIIGRGFNSPPQNKKLERCLKGDLPPDFKSDRTCCIHAEQRATMDALKNNPEKISGSRLYFIRLDENGNKVKSDKPYCTICSKMALDSGIAEFVLMHEEGVCVYDTNEYNSLSFQYRKKQ